MAVVLLHLMRVNILSLKFRIDPVISWHVQEQMVSVCVCVLNVLCECAVFSVLQNVQYFLLKEKRFCTSVDVIKVPSHFLSCSRTAACSGSTWMGFWNKEHVVFLHALFYHEWTTSFRQIVTTCPVPYRTFCTFDIYHMLESVLPTKHLTMMSKNNK